MFHCCANLRVPHFQFSIFNYQLHLRMHFFYRIFPFTPDDVKSVSWRPILLTIIFSLCLVLTRFFVGSQHFDEWGFIVGKTMQEKIHFYLHDHPDAELWDLVYWAGLLVVFYVFIPAFIIKVFLREKLSDYGLKIKGMFYGWKAYALMASFILPVVFFISFSPEFRNTYPFYRFNNPDKLFPQFLIWEAFYILQFFALEFFFRGFIVLGLKPHLKGYSILVMTIPYCMIHFSKPLPECIGSIFAGLILGAMSYRTGSVWLGAALHIAVALSMDTLSLWHRGLLF